MSDQKEGKWLPYNDDGSQHDCIKKSGKEKNQEVALEMVQKKLDSPDIILDVEKLDETINDRSSRNKEQL
jgi:hypothetical protein